MGPSSSALFLRSSVLALTLSFAGCSGLKSSDPPPTATPVTVTLNQSAVSVAEGSTTQFTATIKGSTDTAVTWAVDSKSGGNATVGTISSSGLYTAPAQTGSHTVTATSVAQNSSSAKAAVTVVSGVAVSPSSSTLESGQTQQFNASVTASSNTAVSWSVDGIPSGNSTVGTITSSGLYTAPSSQGSHTITASSSVDTSANASASVAVFTLALSPQDATIVPSTTQQFTATIQGISNTAVNWSVDGVAGGNAASGTITSSGLYTAPSGIGSHTITASSAADPSAAPQTAQLVVINTSLASVLTYHNDDARDGAYLQEVTLTPTNVNSSQFGKLLSYPVDGQIYAQPLYMSQIAINGGTHDVVFVETQNDSVYAFDADATSANPTTFWQRNFGVPFGSYDSGGPYPYVGILSTPVIDATTNTMYLVAEVTGQSSRFYLHALNVATGADVSGSPVAINGSFSGDYLETACYQRMGVALNPVTNWVYLAFGSCTHGWVFAYDKTSLQQTAVFEDTNGAQGGGLWAGGGAPAIDDSTGDLYLMSGTDFGDQEWITGSTMVGYNDSFLRLGMDQSNNFSVLDYFAPDNNYTLASNDADLGAGADMLPPGSTAYPHIVIGGGKDGNVYIVNRDSMGGFNDSSNNVLQTVHTGVRQYNNIFSTPVYWNGTLYYHCNGDVLRAFSWNPTLSPGQQMSSGAIAEGPANFGMHGATASLSANGNTNGILWEIDNSAYTSTGTDPDSSGPSVLYAYDASNIANELYNSAQAGSRDQAGQALKFTVPTIANGRVFVPTATELDIYGLLTQQ